MYNDTENKTMVKDTSTSSDYCTGPGSYSLDRLAFNVDLWYYEEIEEEISWWEPYPVPP